VAYVFLAYAYFLFQLGAHGCPPMKCTRAPQNLAMLLNPVLLHTPIVGVIDVYREAISSPMNTEIEFELIFSSRGVQPTSRHFLRINAY